MIQNLQSTISGSNAQHDFLLQEVRRLENELKAKKIRENFCKHDCRHKSDKPADNESD